MTDILNRITMVPFANDQFLDEVSTKRQIFLHHTASDPSPYGVVDWWKSTSERVATAFVVGGSTVGVKWKDGDVVQTFGSNKWAWHLGLKQEHLIKGGPNHSNNIDMNKMSIGIEICNFGQLTKSAKGYKAYTGTIIPDTQVVEYTIPYRGYSHYQKYTDAQIQTVHDLVVYLGQKYNIPVSYKGDKMFNICPEALCGESGVWTHTSVRPDKFDCHPQPELIEMLKSL